MRMSRLKRVVLRIPGAKWAIRQLRDRLFDFRYHVHTAGDRNLDGLRVLGRNLQHGLRYEVSNPRTVRLILECLPIEDFSDYTFLDYGSGKGRVLLMASEFPFRRIVGIEFATDLHEIAVKNIESYRNQKQKCFDIAAVNMDAADFPLPEGRGTTSLGDSPIFVQDTPDDDFVIPGDPPSSEQHPLGSPFWGAPEVFTDSRKDVSPVRVGHNVVRFSEVGVVRFQDAPAADYQFDPSKLLGVQFYVPTTDDRALPYAFCISNLTFLRE